MRRAGAVALALALLLGAAAAEAKRVRLFAVGPKFELSWVESRDAYRDKLLAMVDGSKRGPGGPPIQEGADDVASHLLRPADPQRPVETARDLVALPEDIGLFAAFSGQRGESARQAPDLTSAIAGLIAAYAPVNAYYAGQFPSLGERPFPPTRLLAVSLTDTFGRTAIETFAEIADTYDVFLEAGVNMVRDWRIVCVSKASMPKLPGGAVCEAEDPAKVAALRAPEDASRTYAYEATKPNPSNMALVFDPDGKLISKQVKSYLTPVELPGQLDLLPGDVSDGLSVLPTPVGRLGFVTSKDAWMPDVTTKLDQAGVEVLVQPEFFVNDTIRTTGPWAPDNIKGSGFSDILRHPSMEALLLPELTGNVFDFSADNQQQIAIKPRSVSRAASGALVGQPRAPGFAVVSPWVVKDPLNAEEPFAARRKRLGEAGEKMLPSGPPCAEPTKPGPCRGGQVEGTIFADVQVGDPRRYRRQRARRGVRPFTRNAPIAPGPRAQRNVALAGEGTRVMAAFEEERSPGKWSVLVTRSTDHGARWAAPQQLAAEGWWPSVAAAGRSVWVAWQQREGPFWRLRVARSTDAGRSFGAPVAVGPAAKAHQWRPSIAATSPDSAVLAWIDERERFTGDDLPQAGLYATTLSGVTPGELTRLDSTATPAPLAATLDHAWAPHVSARGKRAVVTWIDFRTYDWDVYARESADGGATWAAEQAVNDTPAEAEALSDRPQAVIPVAGDPLVAWTDWSKDDRSASTPSPLYDTKVAALTAGPRKPRQADGHGGAHSSTFAPASAPLGGTDVAVAWQDHARGPGDILLARVGPGAIGKALRVDDTASAGWNQWRPALALTTRRLVVAWEDERDGPAQLYVARATPSKVR